MIRTISDLIAEAKTIPTSTLVVAVAQDKYVLEAVEQARKDNIIHPILVGDQPQIESLLTELGYDSSTYTIHHQPDDVSACEHSVKLVHDHDDYFLMKGIVSTSVILKAALNKEYGLRTKNRISHVSVLETKRYPKLLFMSDGGMNIAPTLDEKRQILENAVHIAHSLGLKSPNVGVIGAVEKVNPKMDATLDAEALVKMQQDGIITGCNVAGPFAIDNAINKEAALHKGITNPIAGDVDILLMPRIEAGNVFYKTLMFLAETRSASIIAGATKPIVLTSRADSPESKYYSIALGALVVHH